MKIRIDRDRCIGSGSCQFYAPKTFGLDDECKVIVTDPGGDPGPAIRNAVQSCPVQALELDEQESD